MSNPTHPREEWLTTAGGKIHCARCKATSKRTKQQCGSPAMRDKRVCRIHGGMSTGPKTEAGRQRCAEANTTNGWETRPIRAERRQKLAELKELEQQLIAKGLIAGGRG